MNGERVHAHVASHVPGRLRVRLHPGLHRPQRVAEVRDHLQAQQGVRAVQARPGTGGVLIHYDPAENSVEGLLDLLHDIGVVVVGLTAEEELGEELLESGNSHPADSIMSALDDLDHRLSGATGRKVDLKMLFPFGLWALGLRQLVRSGLGLSDVPAFILLWYGFDAFYKLHRRSAAPTESAE